MGSVGRVRCRKCSYASGELLGVGGGIGLEGRPVWTVFCDRQHSLVDVWAPEYPASKKRYWYKVELPAPKLPCPNCGEVHELWDPEKGACPICGATRCKVVFTARCD